MMNNKPFSQACENNKQAILSVIRNYFNADQLVLEVGSGTGQHAVFFAQNLPRVTWQSSDREENIAGICQWLNEAKLDNALLPLTLDVGMAHWPVKTVDGIFSANSVHIMSWSMVEKMIAGVGLVLAQKAYFCLYGPFNYDGQFSSDSNARFDVWLKERDPLSGVRDFEDLTLLASRSGLRFVDDHEMPANNRLLVWQKV